MCKVRGWELNAQVRKCTHSLHRKACGVVQQGSGRECSYCEPGKADSALAQRKTRGLFMCDIARRRGDRKRGNDHAHCAISLSTEKGMYSRRRFAKER